MTAPDITDPTVPLFSGPWRYFGRRGAEHIYELYRLSDAVTGLELEDTLRMERLKPDGSWVHDPKDHGLHKEMASGWFDAADEIGAADAAALAAAWRSTGWPGRA